MKIARPVEEHAAAAEAIAERGAREQQDGVGEHVGVDGPLERLDEAPRSRRMLGSAIVTTRLSSTTMKSATDTMPSVQFLRIAVELMGLLATGHLLRGT